MLDKTLILSKFDYSSEPLRNLLDISYMPKQVISREGLVCVYLSRSITISQCGVCGKRSTAMALTGWNGSETGIDLALCRARPALLILLHPRLFLFPFSIFSGDGVQSSIAFATKLSGLQEM
jgi:hypothetical protein